ncbi:hypothetical protein BO70DRAFT_412373 [Aspergillus heteromorphus CBS 117.55]|uniref:Response regulatory domain-containing protein n=1 Tax=Aspergillus heteromorphus CBS 117.55 TaxID=1448321 RepID=A0A317VMK3_9EURO|nr:uncharacterized protein BO70DRAFT_412373 [Aspergillus heteromorphus CBS 117.55]PWY75145.1 hypothetical protein BO70DRAFT_412373 [Aspergillus heteromorphus CBS 117.55]
MPNRRWIRLKAKLLRRSSSSSAPAATTTTPPVNAAINSDTTTPGDDKSHNNINPPPTPPPAAENETTVVTGSDSRRVPAAPEQEEEEEDGRRRARSQSRRRSESPELCDPLSRPAVIGAGRGRYYGPFEDGAAAKSCPEEPVAVAITTAEQREGRLRHSAVHQGAGAGSSATRQRQQDATLDRVRPVPNRRHSHSPFSEQLNVNSPPPTTLSPDPLPSPTPTPPLTSSDRFGASSLQLGYSQGLDRLGSAAGEPQLPPVLDVVAENPAGELAYPSFVPTVQTVQTPPASFSKRPSLGSRRQSLLAPSHQYLINSLLEPGLTSEPDNPGHGRLATYNPGMPRKIWVKRPGGSATLVPVSDDYLVDELRDQVIVKYSNSLGKTFDAPDIVIRITPRDGSNRQQTPDRMLSPEESLPAVVDTYYPGGQAIEEALIIDIPQRRTPKPSPRHSVYYNHHSEPGEHGDYFPLMPANPNVPTPPTHPSNSTASVNAHAAPSISILTTGSLPPVPSPGSRGSRHPRRPPLTRHATNSPTILNQTPVVKEPGVTSSPMPPQPAPAMPTPPGPAPESPQAKSLTPPARGSSPRPRPAAKQKKPSATQSLSGVFGGLIEGTVPPINVLIVEDNNINQRLLEAFMKRLSVRWKCAADGEEAVKKWRQGGFHLVLMDIQLPVMNGLDATKEIRRLERLNGIGVFPKTADGRASAANATVTTPPAVTGNSDPLAAEDTLHDLSLFKSPVIIVALTASSLQSDRHEALAAGCNDFLTKPVRFEWLEQKVTEWGCMQALIDFEGWRKWRGYADEALSPIISDGHTSPMQIGGDGVSRKPSPTISPSPSSTASQGGFGAKKERKSLSFLRPIDVTPEDSSGSGEGGLDSPASPVTSAPTDIPTEP